MQMLTKNFKRVYKSQIDKREQKCYNNIECIDCHPARKEEIAVDIRENTISENLKRILTDCNGLDVRLKLQANELIDLYKSAADGDTAYEIIAQESERAASLPVHFASSWLYALSSTLYDRMDEEAKRVHFLSLMGEKAPVDLSVSGKVAYTENKFTLTAFDKFVSIIPDARTLYTDSFAVACKSVYDGLCEFCILPIENMSDGSLFAFYSLIVKYELRIVATTAVSDEDGSDTTLALLSKDGSTSALPKSLRSYRLDINIDGADIALVLALASAFGIEAIRLDSFSSKNSFHLRFSPDKASSDEFGAFLLCISAAFPSFSPLGLYRHVD